MIMMKVMVIIVAVYTDSDGVGDVFAYSDDDYINAWGLLIMMTFIVILVQN